MTKHLVFDDMGQCCEAEVQRLLPLVSEQRRAEALKYKHLFGQFACLKSYELLMQLINENDNGNENLSQDEGRALPTFVCGEHGKPTLAERPGVHFNLSHCKQAIAVAVGDKPVGIDVERFIEPSDSLLRYCMSDTEIEQVRQSVHPEQTFAALWTRKEALVKYYGTGITSDLKGLLSHPDPKVRLVTTLNKEKGYALTIASATD